VFGKINLQKGLYEEYMNIWGSGSASPFLSSINLKSGGQYFCWQ